MLDEPSIQALVLCCRHVNEAVVLEDNNAHRRLIATLRAQVKKLSKTIKQLQIDLCGPQVELQASQNEVQLLAGSLLSVYQLSDMNLRRM